MPSAAPARATRPQRRSPFGRALRIGLAFAGFVLWWAWHRGVMRCDDHPVAERFAALLQGLGTTFVKLGQHLSLRADLLPDTAQQALARLQDHVGAFASEQAQLAVESAFGRPCAQLFTRFDLAPLAAASVAQIHRAALPDGTEVVVKIRRPGAAEAVESDMRILRVIATVAQALLPPLRRWGLVAIVDEIAGNLRLEMDLAREARFVRRFADAWRGSPDVDIPDVVDGLCASSVMVQRFSSGVRIDAAAAPEREACASRLVDSYVTQFFEHGLFHGDPHPGNLFVMTDGRICFHDFGIVGRLDRRLRRALTAFALAFVEQDADWVVDAWLDLGLVGAQVERRAFLPVVQSLLADCAERPLRDWSLPAALGRLVAAGRSQAVRLPTDLLVLTRTMLLLEGTVRALAPAFSIFETLSRHAAAGSLRQAPQPEASKRLAFEMGSAASALPALVAQRLHGAFARERLFEITIVPDARLQEGVERASQRIALALVTLGLYIASSLLMQHAVGPQFAGMPLLALAGYALAIRFTFSIARGRQDDMTLAGVADIVDDYRLQVAARAGLPVHAATPQAEAPMRAAGIAVAGGLSELLAQSDVVVDCTPKKVAAINKGVYEAAGLKAIFHGGESHALTGHSFVAQANYASAFGRSSTRVVSCNTTSIVRTLGALRTAGLLKRARGTLIRRASDPWEAHADGIVNTVVPEKVIPSHQGPDARTVIPDLDVVTIAVKAAHNSSHLHTWWVELTRPATRDEVLAAFRAAPRIAFVRSSDGIVALNSTVELMSDLGRPRGDMWEVALWEDALAVDGDQAYYTYQVFNQAIVIPETIDAIRALTGIETDPARSIAKTDASLGLRRDFLR